MTHQHEARGVKNMPRFILYLVAALLILSGAVLIISLSSGQDSADGATEDGVDVVMAGGTDCASLPPPTVTVLSAWFPPIRALNDSL